MTLVDHDGLALVALGSGSGGNATWIGTPSHGVLVDCGVSTKQILARLEAAGLAGASIDAVLITHEHEDHVGSVAVLDRKLAALRGAPVPFFLTEGTLAAIPHERRPQRPVVVSAGARVELGSLLLEAHPVPHDTADPVAWAVEAHGVRAGVITDLGHAPRLVSRLLASLDLAVLEFNHDEQLLQDGTYPWALKQRIRGRHGHLSNRQAAELLAQAADRVAHLLLAHLSEENNRPQIALEEALAALHRAGRSDVVVHVAEPRVPVGPVRLGAAPPPRPSAASTTHAQGWLFGD